MLRETSWMVTALAFSSPALPATSTSIAGNRFGLISPNDVGIQITQLASGTTIGGATLDDSNTISGNEDAGILIQWSGSPIRASKAT